jgi:hypothetical protein
MDVERLLTKELGNTHHRFNTLDFNPSTTPSFYPSSSIYNGDDSSSSYYNTYAQRRVSILSYEEIVGTELFREYYSIPLFRQFLEQYPTVFRKYIESPLFQQFWTYSQFQQYFRNPVYFYKYIVPQVSKNFLSRFASSQFVILFHFASCLIFVPFWNCLNLPHLIFVSILFLSLFLSRFYFCLNLPHLSIRNCLNLLCLICCLILPLRSKSLPKQKEPIPSTTTPEAATPMKAKTTQSSAAVN